MSHRPARINPDSLGVLIVATVLTVGLAAVSFLLSFNGLSDAAAWANVPPWLAWGIPAYVDGAILVYTVAALVFRARGESARMAWASLALYASLSVAANGVHAWPTAPEEVKVTLGVLLAALAPVAVLLTTHTIARLIVAPPSAEAASEAPTSAEPDTTTPEADELYDPRWKVQPRPEAAPVPDFVPGDWTTTDERDARIRAIGAESPRPSTRDIAARVGRVSKSHVARILGPNEEARPAPAIA